MDLDFSFHLKISDILKRYVILKKGYCRFPVTFPQNKYLIIPMISPGLCYAYFRRGLLLEGILHFKMGWLDNKNSLKQLKQLTLTVHGLIFGRVCYRKDICV